MEREARGATTGATDAPQASTQPAAGSESAAQKSGVGGEGWNEDFDEAWGRRVLENSKIKDLFGLSDYSSLRDEETRRQINRYLRDNRNAAGDGGSAGTAASAPAQGGAKPPTATATAPVTKQPPGTTGATSLPGQVPPSGPPRRSTSIFAPGRLPSPQLWQNTILPTSGGTLPAQRGPWWPSYSPGGLPAASKPGTATFQAKALESQ